jgi:hypothetical protein
MNRPASLRSDRVAGIPWNGWPTSLECALVSLQPPDKLPRRVKSSSSEILVKWTPKP